MNRVYFDMDGVLADFNGGVIDLLGFFPRPQTYKDPEYVDFFFDSIRDYGHFYRDLKPCEEMIDLFHKISDNIGLENVQVLTGVPGKNRNIEFAESDKREWIKKYISENVIVNCVRRRDKANFCSGKNSILIDDYQDNINDWIKIGGTGILHIDYANTVKLVKSLNLI